MFTDSKSTKFPKTHEGVARAWRAGVSLSNSTGNFRTDGSKIYSYALVIGKTHHKKGTKIALDYTRGGGWFKSMTTSRHCSHCKNVADEVRGFHSDNLDF